MRRKIVILVLIIAVVYIVFYFGNFKKYTYDKLNNLSAKELYEVFVENGLQADKEIRMTLTEDEIAEFLKQEFDLLIEGSTARSHKMYFNFAKEVKRVYEKIVR